MIEQTKVLCAIKNPSTSKNRAWLYNIFLGNIHKKKKVDHGHQKVNFLMHLTPMEIEVLKKKGCEIITINNEVNETKKDQFKDGFTALLDLFDKAMKNINTKSEIRKLLSNGDGRPTEQYNIIMRSKDLLKNNEVIK